MEWLKKGDISTPYAIIIALLVAIILEVFWVGNKVVNVKPLAESPATGQISAAPTQAMTDSGYVETPFCDGYDWRHLGSLGLPKDQVNIMKDALVKATVESSTFSGNPLMSLSTPTYLPYIAYIDRFYQSDAEVKVPLYFALKLADVAQSGASPQKERTYRMFIMQQLTQMGVLKPVNADAAPQDNPANPTTPPTP